ncbi:MAG: 50S ribosomal protein L23 [Candidatus Eremiobacteraeota bacterium]|nr:50S ribosomal protein L23 [Candidatus Eremiobacteraeota bacterium]
MLELRRIVRRPLVTEKSVSATAHAQYAFEVDKRASKHTIKDAIQRLFKVTVLRVNTVNVPPKTGRNMRRPTRKPVELRSAWKKAIVTLKAGDKIELGGVNYFES